MEAQRASAHPQHPAHRFKFLFILVDAVYAGPSNSICDWTGSGEVTKLP